MTKSLGKLTVAILWIALASLFAYSQTNGSLAGTVSDSTGAAIPNATVIAAGAGGKQLTATTGDNGTYRIPAVANGFYTVSITADGFKKQVVSNVKVDVGLPATVDAQLSVGDIAEVVEVSSGGEVLQTQTATVGTTISGKQITDTPLPSFLRAMRWI